MTQFLTIGDGSIQKAAMVVQEGGLVVFPTDTVYGLGCNPFHEKAVHNLALVKQRNKGNFPVLVDTITKARELGHIGTVAESLASRFWPGPLTIVVPSRAAFPFQISGREKTVGLRIPRRPDTLELISRSGGTLVGTSANISGSSSSRDAKEALHLFEGKVDIVLDGGLLPTNLESTVVRLSESSIQVLREGAISQGDLRTAISSTAET
jgi:L-threonylcarbamoyladenylate synthase